MNTLSLISSAGAIRTGPEMNTLRLFPALSRKFSRNENFLLAIPFFAHELQIAALRASPALQTRLDGLALKANEGELSVEERAQYESYVEALDLIDILQVKARKILVSVARA